MNVVNTDLRRTGIRTLLYVDDLLACVRSETETLLARDIISQTLETADIKLSPTKGQWVPRQTMHDHLGTIISSIGQGSLQPPDSKFALRNSVRDVSPSKSLLLSRAVPRKVLSDSTRNRRSQILEKYDARTPRQFQCDLGCRNDNHNSHHGYIWHNWLW